jgi:serine/threonine-protein kinase
MGMQNSPARSPIDVGSVIAGTYTIEALIGRGGMGAVFLASHARLPGKKVAIKLLHAEISDDEVLARFKREAQIASMLGHPNIVGVENFDVMPDGTPYLVLEYLEGETLAHRLKAGPLQVEAAMSIVRQIGSALQAAHKAGIVHRDLKPQNIFLVPTEFDGRVVEVAKVLDFGISKMRGSQTVKTQDSALLGTPQYMAPEQATGQHANVDERTDIFALGAIVYEMLAGKPAFEGASIPEVVFKVVYEQPVPLAKLAPGVPAAIATAVHKALAKEQAERPQTVNAFVEALTGRPLPEKRPGSSPVSLDGRNPSSQRKLSQQDALAQTVGSGDHGESLAAAATVSSQSGPAPAPAPPPKRSRVPLIAAAIGLCGVAAIAFALLSNHGAKHDESVPAEPVPTEPPKPAPPPPPPAPVVAAHDELPPIQTHKGTPPAPPRGKPSSTDGGSQKKAAAVAPPEPDDGCGEKMDAAEHALTAKNYDLARTLANVLADTDTCSSTHRQQAQSIVGIIQCVDKHNDDAALTALRQIHTDKLHRRVISECHAAGQLTGTQ